MPELELPSDVASIAADAHTRCTVPVRLSAKAALRVSRYDSRRGLKSISLWSSSCIILGGIVHPQCLSFHTMRKMLLRARVGFRVVVVPPLVGHRIFIPGDLEQTTLIVKAKTWIDEAAP
jgi:hypothetical protein